MLLSLSGCQPKDEAEKNEISANDHAHSEEIILRKDQMEEMQIEIVSLDTMDFYHSIRTTGIVEIPPQHSAAVSVYFEGYVKDIFPYAGEAIQKGQKLFVLENPKYLEIQRDFLEAKAMLSMLEADYLRQATLSEDKVTSQKHFSKVKAEFEVAKTRFKSLYKMLEMMQLNPSGLSADNLRSQIIVRAPIAGNLNKVNIRIGAYLKSSDVAMEIVNLEHPHIELMVLEKDISLVQEKQEIVFSIQDGTEKKYLAEVHLVNRTIDEETRTASIHGHLLNKMDAFKLSAGMFVEASILSERTKVRALPEESIVEVDNHFYILLLEGKEGSEMHFKPVEISKGRIFEGKIEVLNAADFPSGSRFLGRGAFALLNDGSTGGHNH